MLEDIERKELIKHRIKKAKKTVEEIDFLIKNDLLDLAINRIYYGIFYMLSALALKYQFSTSKHHQLIGWFNKKFIKEGLIDKKYGSIIHKAYDKRTKGDYDDFVEFSKEEVSELFKNMKEFLFSIEELISIND
ncbi:MAG: HEPN domain-containing protein [candidate division WOR-3 bacterium]|nr:HEPN domain-containing protein [candidate division WOR-3 bacterium]